MTKTGAACILGVVALAAAAGWWFGRPPPIVETSAPQVTQADGSLIVARAPDAKAKPKQQIPRGAKLERTIHIEAQGQGLKLPNGEVKPCPPVSVDLSLVREPSGAKRVLASSPDGQIVGAVDIPVETLPTPEARPWAAGLSLNPINQTAGIWLERDIGRVRLGLDLNQARQSLAAPVGAELRVRVGWVF